METLPADALEVRIKRAQEVLAAILKEERLAIKKTVDYERGPDNWIRAVANIKFVVDKG